MVQLFKCRTAVCHFVILKKVSRPSLNKWRGGGKRVSERVKIGHSKDSRLKDTQNLKCEDRRLHNNLVLKVEDLAAKPEN